MKIDERLFGERVRYPILFLDYIFWAVFDLSKYKKVRKDRIKKILIIHTGAIGEMVAMTPLIRALKKELHCKITCMIAPSEDKKKLLIDNPCVDEVIFFEGTRKQRINTLKKEQFDLAVIFPASFANALMCFQAGIRYRLGIFSRIKRSPTLFYTRRTFPIGVRHTVAQSLEVLKNAGIPDDGWKTDVVVPKKVKKEMKNLMKKKYVIVQPGFGPTKKSKGPPRQWPMENYEYIIRLDGKEVWRGKLLELKKKNPAKRVSISNKVNYDIPSFYT